MSSSKVRWLVRDLDGKIYGPLSTDKVLKQISEGFFSGNEDVSLYPDGKWISISKEAKFYDALLDVLDREIHGGKKPTDKPPEMGEVNLEPELSKTGEPPRGVERGHVEQEENPHDMQTHTGVPEPEEGLSRVEDYEDQEDNEEVIELTDVHQIKKREKVKASGRPLLIFTVGIAIIMAPFIQSRFNRYYWSKCSRKQIKDNLQ